MESKVNYGQELGPNLIKIDNMIHPEVCYGKESFYAYN